MGEMSRPRPPYLLREKTRHGTVVWYVRKGEGPRTRIKGEYGSAEFMAAYHLAVSGTGVPTLKAGGGTLRWLVERYRDSGAWCGLALATRKQRENILLQVLATAGDEPFSAINRAAIVAGRERRAATPAQARNFLDAVRGLFRWALDTDHVVVDPTAGVKNPKRPKGDGFPVWTEADVERYEARWPVGTKERVWLDVLLYTGLRRGDAVHIGRQHIRDGVATLKTEKSGGTTEVTLPILDTLAATLAVGPCGDLAFICGERGQPLTKETFGNMFREACREAGVAKSAHGVRKIGATRAANRGASVSQLEAIFGWKGGGMASLYTKAADRRRLAKEAMGLLDKEQPSNNLTPHLSGKPRTQRKSP